VKNDLNTKLIASFKELISQGALQPGCKLPPERELAAQFGVSRPSIRQALKVMEIMGVLSQRVGDGTYLSKNASAILSEPLEFLVLLDGISHIELFEARMIVEPELAARAAERASAEDITTIRKALSAFEASLGDMSKAVEQDLAFHDSIFRAAGNRVCRQMLRGIHRAILASISRLSQRADLDRVVSAHRAIYQAIYRRNPEEARLKMAEHLNSARALFLREPPAQPRQSPASIARLGRKLRRSH
jgi:GntR family transcriptional repressor for pyruvate dehydrogenase complex